MRTSKPLVLGGGNSNLTPLLACAATLLLALDLHATDRFVSPTGSHSPPFTDWSGAATNIQAAIDAAAAGDVVWVTNGIYDTGGRAKVGTLTNRVALDKALTVQSVNGAASTVIEGRWDPSNTLGPSAVRCAWLTNGAVLRGFTLRNGATDTNNLPDLRDAGGGVWGSSTNAWVESCIITNSRSEESGGGAWSVLLRNCLIISNACLNPGQRGGGAANSLLLTCEVKWNLASSYANGYGGGVEASTCEGTSLVGNQAGYGGGASYSKLTNCRLTGNLANYNGGGAYDGILNNCAIIKNQVGITNYNGLDGGGCFRSTLNNCTVASNVLSCNVYYPPGGSVPQGAGVRYGTNNNCIIWGNALFSTGPYGNLYTNNNNCGEGTTVRYSCFAGLSSVTGPGITNANPLLMPDGIHVASNSPCRGAGSASYASGKDIDGQLWATPPSMGCDEWGPEPVAAVGPSLVTSTNTERAWLTMVAYGQGQLGYRWLKDGQWLQDSAHHTNTEGAVLGIHGFGPGDGGAYQVVISNAYGWATSSVTRFAVRCVDTGNAAPAAPFTNWDTAAATIQEAIDASSPGDVVIATNGLYATGGRTFGGGVTNRVVLDKPLTLLSINGAEFTVIEGRWDPLSTNGPLSVRGAWLEDGAALKGFTIRNGSTTLTWPSAGGGIYCSVTAVSEVQACIVSNNVAARGGGISGGIVSDSQILSNSAASEGGGAYGCTLIRSTVIGNKAQLGGGVSSASASGSRLLWNSASGYGGGAHNSTLRNCMVVSNTAANGGGSWCAPSGTLVNCLVGGNSAGFSGGVWGARITNSIVWGNFAGDGSSSNGVVSSAGYSVFAPPKTGPGNLSVDPQLVDGLHLAATSPCRGAGTAAYAAGVDLEGRPWANPPSMGCVEVLDSDFTGPLAVALVAPRTNVAATGRLPFTAVVTGRAARLEWDFSDGRGATNLGWQTSCAWPVPGAYPVRVRAYNSDWPAGVEASVVVQVVPCAVPAFAYTRLPGTVLDLTFPTQYGVSYLVEYATNLAAPATWTPVVNWLGDDAPKLIHDAYTTNAAKFYRIRTQ